MHRATRLKIRGTPRTEPSPCVFLDFCTVRFGSTAVDATAEFEWPGGVEERTRAVIRSLYRPVARHGASPSFSLEDTSPPWSADVARPECGRCWQLPRDSEPPGHGAHPGPMCRAAENHSRNPSWPASLPWWSARETRPRRPRHPAAPARWGTATGGRE